MAFLKQYSRIIDEVRKTVKCSLNRLRLLIFVCLWGKIFHMKDYYQILGVDKNASIADITKPTASWPASTTPT